MSLLTFKRDLNVYYQLPSTDTAAGCCTLTASAPATSSCAPKQDASELGPQTSVKLAQPGFDVNAWVGKSLLSHYTDISILRKT